MSATFAGSGPFGNQPSKCLPTRSTDASAAPPIQTAGTVWHGPERALLHRPAALPVDRFAGPEGAAKAQAFQHATDALLERDARGFELVADVRHVRGDADAEDDAALGNLVQRRDLVRQYHRVAQRRKEYRRAEFDPFRPAGDACEQGDRLVPRPGEEGVAHPDRIVAESLGALGQRQQRCRRRMSLHDALAGRQKVTDARGHGVVSGGFCGMLTEMGCLPDTVRQTQCYPLRRGHCQPP